MAPSGILKDPHGRHIRKLRVALLDRCNFRCFYCMSSDASFLPTDQLLKADQIEEICRVLVEQGISRIRVTGGEPTLRRDFVDIMTRLSRLPLETLGLTSNGFLLQPHLPFLQECGCHNVNISLDSLSEDRFHKITNSRGFDKVLSSVLEAKALGFNVKINVLLLRGINDDELLDFVAFSATHDIEVRFLELIKAGLGCGLQEDHFFCADDAMARIGGEETLIPETVDFDSTTFNFRTEKGARIGFIASETKSFCASCSRLRLSATGTLRACLMSEEGIDLRDVPKENYRDVLETVMACKPIKRIASIDQQMYQIGG